MHESQKQVFHKVTYEISKNKSFKLESNLTNKNCYLEVVEEVGWEI